eukprot:CAMPEP_0201282728 /NCGR_PEP_ID=MMETSP1317-20130820/6517_1 /ASSEMBLY_ACC=CAM_ASM_000770 /TAXON_ID=187299 /ORGANISM="Undescribed Undescribed, Strain Undescribed" /LENGTH=36 /DNA_ID= /DNA_START= /DNA_END= /DNA_ORIENTATION=
MQTLREGKLIRFANEHGSVVNVLNRSYAGMFNLWYD